MLAWVFELMPEGIRRTEPLDSPDARSEHERKTIRQKLNITIITVLLLAVALLGWQVVTLRERPLARGLASSADAAQAPGPIAATGEAPVASDSASSVRSAIATPAPAERSLAVLPFSNQTGGKEQQFFSDGLTWTGPERKPKRAARCGWRPMILPRKPFSAPRRHRSVNCTVP